MPIEAPFVTVARFDWRMPANLARCRLESCGIEVVLADENTMSLCWHYAEALGGMRLQVRREDEEDAREVLAEEPMPLEDAAAGAHERVTERALLSAVFGTIIWPLALYGIWLLLPVFRWRAPMTAKEQRNILSAVPLLALPFVVFILYTLDALLQF